MNLKEQILALQLPDDIEFYWWQEFCVSQWDSEFGHTAPEPSPDRKIRNVIPLYTADQMRDLLAAAAALVSAQGEQKLVGAAMEWPDVVWGDGSFATPPLGTKLYIYTQPQPQADEKLREAALGLIDAYFRNNCGENVYNRMISLCVALNSPPAPGSKS